MKRKLLKSFLGLAAAASLFLTGCSGLFGGDVDTTDSTSETTTRTSTAQSTYTLNEDGTVTFKLGATSPLDSIIKNARTIAPETPTLYYTVYGSTVSATDTNSVVYADYAAGKTSGDVVTDVYYPTIANKTTGIEFTIGISTKVWYFTAYGTYKSPDDVFTDASLDADATDTEKVAAIAAAAVVRGTLKLYITENANGTVTFSETNGGDPSSMVISAKNISSDAGEAIIPVDIPATATGIKEDLKVGSVKIALVGPASATTVAKEVSYSGIGGAATKFAFDLTGVVAGSYDVEVIVYNTATTPEEIFSIEDKLYILPGVKSYVLKGSTDFTATVAYSGSISADGTSLDSSKNGSNYGYVLTTELLEDYRRRIFFVSATGSDTDGTGSIFAPFATVKKAADTIGSRLSDGDITGTGSNKSTEWWIMVSGAPTETDAITFANTTASQDAIIRISKYGTGTATISPDITFSANESSGEFRVMLSDVTLSGDVTIATPNIYIKNTIFNGLVTLKKYDASATTPVQDGRLNACADDTTSKAKKITLEGTYNTIVVNHIDSTSTIDIDGDNTADTCAVAFDDSTSDWENQYALDSSYVTDPNDSASTRVLEVATDQTDTARLGDLIVKIKQSSISIIDDANRYYAVAEIVPDGTIVKAVTGGYSISKADVTTNPINLKFKVYSKNTNPKGMNLTNFTYKLKDGYSTTVPMTGNYSVAGATSPYPTLVEDSSDDADYTYMATTEATLSLSSPNFSVVTNTYTFKITFDVGSDTGCFCSQEFRIYVTD